MSNEARSLLKLKYRGKLEKYARKVNRPASDAKSLLAKLHSAGLDWFNAHEVTSPDENLDEDLLYLCETAIPKHYRFVRDEVTRLELPPGTYQPSQMAFADIQRRVAKFQPQKVAFLRQSFIDHNLPVYGFDHPNEPPRSSTPSTPQSLTVVINNGPQYLNHGQVGAMGEGASLVLHPSVEKETNRVSGP